MPCSYPVYTNNILLTSLPVQFVVLPCPRSSVRCSIYSPSLLSPQSFPVNPTVPALSCFHLSLFLLPHTFQNCRKYCIMPPRMVTSTQTPHLVSPSPILVHHHPPHPSLPQCPSFTRPGTPTQPPSRSRSSTRRSDNIIILQKPGNVK